MKEAVFKFWYPRRHRKVLPEFIGHIEYEGGLLCKEARNLLIEDAEADDGVVLRTRLDDNQLCPECVEIYKKHPLSPWKKWDEATQALRNAQQEEDDKTSSDISYV